jgi:lipid-A-disaccharide synthase
VPEFIQHEATADNLANALLERLEDSDAMHQLHETFQFIHRQLRRGADDEAASAIAELIHSER